MLCAESHLLSPLHVLSLMEQYLDSFHLAMFDLYNNNRTDNIKSSRVHTHSAPSLNVSMCGISGSNNWQLDKLKLPIKCIYNYTSYNDAEQALYVRMYSLPNLYVWNFMLAFTVHYFNGGISQFLFNVALNACHK